MIVLDIISDLNDGIGTKITEYDVVDDSLNLKHEYVSLSKLWDYVGDRFMKNEIEVVFGKAAADEGRYLIIVEKESEGDYYSKTVLKSLFNQIANIKYKIIDNYKMGEKQYESNSSDVIR